ncbi:MAG: HepT-like ribonuclease domain-containing protein [Armatimonadota bacterium]
MLPRDRASLIDIVESTQLLQGYQQGKSREDFLNDVQLQDAMIRRFEIIGEAATRISPAFRAGHPEIPWQEIRAMRNVLAHIYDGVQLDTVWETAQHDLEPLRIAVEKILATETQ